MASAEAKNRDKKRSFPIFAVVASAAFLLFLIRSSVAIKYMKKGLDLCAGAVIPSLFPFMIISELLIQSGVGQRVGRLLVKPTRLLFGISEAGACAFVLGAICGFPIGTKTLCSLYDRGEISSREFSRALTFCNNPGSAFIISAVGVSLLGSVELGITLYGCVLLSAVIVGVFERIFFGKIGDGQSKSGYSAIAFERKGAIEVFTSAIQSSAISMVTVCAYVVFFSSFVGCIGSIIAQAAIPSAVTAMIFGFFEISSGMGAAVEVGSPLVAVILCAAGAGWSGLSVHFQIITICSGRGVSFKPFFIAKAAQGLICAALMWVALKIFPFSEEALARFPMVEGVGRAYSNAAFVCCVFFVAAVLPIVLGRRK